MKRGYVHGYSPQESTRLDDQAATLAKILHHNTRFPPGSRVLEAGCGIGAQTTLLAQNSPEADIISLDISPISLHYAKERAERENIENVRFLLGDIFHLPFRNDRFDNIFVCFLLEHLINPLLALVNFRNVLVPGGSITVIEGDHRSALFYPDSESARKTIESLITLQAFMGGNALIGRELFPLLTRARFNDVIVTPHVAHIDGSRSSSVDGMKKTFIGMIEGVREEVLSRGLIDLATWEQGIQDLHRTTEPDGTFYYTFFKGTGKK